MKGITMRGMIRALTLAASLLAVPVGVSAQALPDQIRNAGVTVAQWDGIKQEVRRAASARAVSEQALVAVAERVGVELSRGGRIDLDQLLRLIDGRATQIKDLQERLTLLATSGDPATAGLLGQARAAMDTGDLDGAERILGDARQAARLSREKAQLREAEVVSLEAQVKALRFDYLGAAALYEEAAETAPETETKARWEYRMKQALALRQRGQVFGEPEPLTSSVRLYRDTALPLAPRARAPADWATTQNELGLTLTVVGERGDKQALDDALAAFRAALEVRARATAPADWAETQTGLGAALMRLGEQGDDQAMRDAIQSFRAALAVRTRAGDTRKWADTESVLGAALTTLGRSGDDQAQRDAQRGYPRGDVRSGDARTAFSSGGNTSAMIFRARG